MIEIGYEGENIKKSFKVSVETGYCRAKDIRVGKVNKYCSKG
ncbi:hypothetical protein [Citroniella saccharovorans]|nr:hypothetical protein [Citroniella saccharovorans]